MDGGSDGATPDATISDASIDVSEQDASASDASDAGLGCTSPDGAWFMVPPGGNPLGSYIATGLAVDCTGAYTTSLRSYAPQIVRVDKWNAEDGGSAWSVQVPPADAGGPLWRPVGAGTAGVYASTVLATQIERRDPATGAILWTATDNTVTGFIDIAVDAFPYTIASVGTGCRVDKRSATDGSIMWSASIPSCSPALLRATSNALFVLNQKTVELVRIDSSGSVSWTIPSPYLNGVAADATHVYVAGAKKNTTSGYLQWAVARFDASSGAPVWDVTFDPTCTGPCTPYASDVSANAVAIAGSRLFVSGFQQWFTTINGWQQQWHLVELDPTNGNALDDRAGPAGARPVQPSFAAADPSAVYLLGGNSGAAEYFLLGRWQ